MEGRSPSGLFEATKPDGTPSKAYNFYKLPGVSNLLDFGASRGFNVSTFGIQCGGNLIVGAAGETGYVYSKPADALATYATIAGSAGLEAGGSAGMTLGLWKYDSLSAFSGTAYTFRIEISFALAAARVYFRLPDKEILGF